VSGTVRIPTYTYGSYRSQDGTWDELTADKMQAMVKNTNFVIKSKAFIPTFGYVGYDHPVFGKVKDTDAHGHIKAAHYNDGVVELEVLPIPDRDGRARLIDDAKAGRRPHVSGEHKNDFSFVDETGKTVFVGPTILGLAALGNERPALKNPKIIPLSELTFPDSVPAADAFATRERLRESGFVAQTFSEGVLVFSEVKLSTDVDDEPKEQPMTAEDKAEFERMLTAQATQMRTAFDAQLAEVKKDADQKITAMSEGAENRRKVLDKVAIIVKEKKLSAIPAGKLEIAALTPTTENVLAFGETLSAVTLPGGTAKKEGDATREAAADEPAALDKLRVKHFSDLDANQTEIAAGIVAFGEYKPKEFADAAKGKTGLDALVAQREALKQYVTQRDTAAN
jgi:hypothetical protein